MPNKEFPLYNIEGITQSFIQVFDKGNIDHLTKEAYKFATLYLGFIAHYNHHTFKDTYRDDLSSFVAHISHQNIDRYHNDKWFTNEYGPAYCDSIYQIGTRVIKAALQHLPAIKSKQFAQDRQAAKTTIQELKKKYDL
jgi:hypothetical protein